MLIFSKILCTYVINLVIKVNIFICIVDQNLLIEDKKHGTFSGMLKRSFLIMKLSLKINNELAFLELRSSPHCVK